MEPTAGFITMEEIGLALSSSVTVVLTWWVIMLIARKTVLYVPLILSFVAVGLIHPFLDRKTYPSPVTLNTQICRLVVNLVLFLSGVLGFVLGKFSAEISVPTDVFEMVCGLIAIIALLCGMRCIMLLITILVHLLTRNESEAQRNERQRREQAADDEIRRRRRPSLRSLMPSTI